jgi:hypothetical protein
MPSKFDQFPLPSFGHIPDLGHCQKFFFADGGNTPFSGNPPEWLRQERHQQTACLALQAFSWT